MASKKKDVRDKKTAYNEYAERLAEVETNIRLIEMILGSSYLHSADKIATEVRPLPLFLPGLYIQVADDMGLSKAVPMISLAYMHASLALDHRQPLSAKRDIAFLESGSYLNYIKILERLLERRSFLIEKIRSARELGERKLLMTTKVYDFWLGLLTFLTFMSLFLTATSFLPFSAGTMVTLASFGTLLLFAISR